MAVSRVWNVWGINPWTEQLVQLVLIADDHLAACRQLERCGLILVDAAEHHEPPGGVLVG
jgi:hypothetical protein